MLSDVIYSQQADLVKVCSMLGLCRNHPFGIPYLPILIKPLARGYKTFFHAQHS